jgi:Xaa-Pro aminopeptidase
MVRAINATNSGLAQLILNLKAGILECELSDIFEFYGRKNDRRPLAFPTITASGVNATCLHYPTQNCAVRDNEMVLFDLGYKHEGYCADISRTYPVNGKFEGVQKDIYEAVLNCNKAVIEHVRSGMTIRDLQEFTREYLRNECIRLGLMEENEDIGQYYYHGISHHLGLDTHDISNREKPLENGNVITVEPGLYFKKHKCGVRIEDDVLIQDGRGVNLSSSIAKEMHDIEKLFKTKY